MVDGIRVLRCWFLAAPNNGRRYVETASNRARKAQELLAILDTIREA